MYLGDLANGNSYERDKRRREKEAAIRSRCQVMGAASAWTAAKYGVGGNPRALGKPTIPPARGNTATYEAHAAFMKSLGYPPRINKYWFECRDGYPEYMQFQFQQAAGKLIPTAKETAEAFVEEVKTIAPTVPVEKPKVVTPPDSRLAPPAPITVEQPIVASVPQSLIERYRTQQAMVTTPVDSRRPTPVPPETPAEKPGAGAGIGAALAIGIPIALAIAGG